ncbi:DEKNAAC102418 [Brettanomyces naardenensis]|uniref:DEKNAAC102418 n=1 Tax=Brettanomyces naardenensis TaxID=13370 RepID=A0A448YLP9_BRENA|nr:DEKNAAC102418 [Brettanomyces naardenensis]
MPNFGSQSDTPDTPGRIADAFRRHRLRQQRRRMTEEDNDGDVLPEGADLGDDDGNDNYNDDAHTHSSSSSHHGTPSHDTGSNGDSFAGGFDDEAAFSAGIRSMEGLGLVDIGNLATWTASSSKAGFGMKELREDSPFSYWQSDGQQPHFITIHFTKKVAIERICLYLNYEADESYTPSKMLILSGSGDHDLVEVASREMTEPMGWQIIQFKGIRYDNSLRCHLIKICLLSNHQNGKDSHVRCLKVMSRQKEGVSEREDEVGFTEVGFTSVKLRSESGIR